MRTRAAVAPAAGKRLEIMEANLDGARSGRAGDVLVEIKATGHCHTGPMIRGPMTLAKIGQSDMGLS